MLWLLPYTARSCAGAHGVCNRLVLLMRTLPTQQRLATKRAAAAEHAERSRSLTHSKKGGQVLVVIDPVVGAFLVFFGRGVAQYNLVGCASPHFFHVDLPTRKPAACRSGWAVNSLLACVPNRKGGVQSHAVALCV